MKNEEGFTLIEILVALAVFAILASITAGAMHYAFNTRARVNEQAERLHELQLALTFIEHDTDQMVLRSIQSGHERVLYPAFVGKEQYLELTRIGIANPDSIDKRSILQRVAYLCRSNQLIRRTWKSLDQIDRNFYQDKLLIDNLTHCQFAYLNQNNEVVSAWRANALRRNQHIEPLPKAIRINLTLQDWDKMSLLFIVPESLYGAFYAEK